MRRAGQGFKGDARAVRVGRSVGQKSYGRSDGRKSQRGRAIDNRR